MVKIYYCKDDKLSEMDINLLQIDRKEFSTIWIDLFNPEEHERQEVEKFLTIELPTKEEIEEIESSSRLYQEDKALFMTVSILKKEDDINYRIVPTNFIVKENVLVTMRHEQTNVFQFFLKSLSKKETIPLDSPISLLLGVIEIVVDNIADTLENISSVIEMKSKEIFSSHLYKANLGKILITMGIEGEINSKARECLVSISRMTSYLKFNSEKENVDRFLNRLNTVNVDSTDLKDHSTFLGNKMNFILDAALGLINTQQNNIIKILSVVAVVFLPPTLIASIYGMNFYIPEISWKYGYPMSLVLMILSATLPYWYFKKKGWM